MLKLDTNKTFEVYSIISRYCQRAILGVKHLSSVAKPLCFNLKSSQGSALYPSTLSDASLNNCSCHSVPLGYVGWKWEQFIYESFGMWLVSNWDACQLRMVASGSTIGFGLVLWGVPSLVLRPMYRLNKNELIGFIGL